jgi:hypothetical protein
MMTDLGRDWANTDQSTTEVVGALVAPDCIIPGIFAQYAREPGRVDINSMDYEYDSRYRSWGLYRLSRGRGAFASW